MTAILLLFAVGLMFLLVEVLVPGGILGTMGALLMFGASALSFFEFGTVGGCIALGVALLLAVLAFYIEFRLLPRTAAGKRAFLNCQITGTSSVYGQEAAALIGSSAQSLTVLAPSGYISIQGKRYEAFCQSGHLPVGTDVRVIAADNFRLVVTPVSL